MGAEITWKQLSTNYTEEAIGVVRDCIALMRATGTGTKAALLDAAPALGVSERRIRSLFYRDRSPVVLRNEWFSMRYRAGLVFLNGAAELRALADRVEARGDELVSEQLELPWEPVCTKSVPRRRCA
jgi:hypothetical protein